MIRAEEISARAGEFELRNVTFSVAPGRALVILGPSGAGKTLLLETLLGLRRPTHGRVMLDGEDVTNFPPEARGVSYMPQDVALFPHLSIRENILFGRRVRGTLASADADLERLASRLHIEHLLARPSIRSLSGGERQRVGLARALVVHPRVLLLDESFSALDAHIRGDLQAQCRDLQRALDITAVYVTHHHEECFALGDEALVLMKGQVVQQATPTELFAYPASIEVARFLRKRNVLRVSSAKVEGDRARVVVSEKSGLTLTAPRGAASALCVHIEPDAIDLLRERTEERICHDVVNELPGEIVSMINDGTRNIVSVRVAEDVTLDCVWLTRDHVRADVAVGRRVTVSIPPSAIACVPGSEPRFLANYTNERVKPEPKP